MPEIPDEYIFVYGTLRRGITTPMSYVLERHGEYLADGYMQGLLYDVGDYPGAVESDDPQHRVKGEVYRILDRDLVLSRLDEYEECAAHCPQPHEYIRKALPITLVDGGKVSAWVYVYNRDVSSLVLIESGDYLQRHE